MISLVYLIIAHRENTYQKKYSYDLSDEFLFHNILQRLLFCIIQMGMFRKFILYGCSFIHISLSIWVKEDVTLFLTSLSIVLGGAYL